MQKKWQIQGEIKDEFRRLFPEINDIMLQLLFNRGIISREGMEKFLNADYAEHLYDPFLFRDMKKAVLRIIEAVKNNEKIIIFGDYDADGVTSVVVLEKVLNELISYEAGIRNKKELQSKIKKQKSEINIYIPHRGREGYGLNKEALKYIKENGNSLIITVDCGSSNFREVEFANSLGLDIIITDHHQPPSSLPASYAIINPKIVDDKYPFRELAGVGVAFKLAQALIREIGKEALNLEALEKWLLDLVAVGTIADCCPLIDENRVLVKYGLIVLNKTKNLGLRALINAVGIAKRGSNSVKYSNAGQEIDNFEISSWNVGFQIAPRINSAGRLTHANTAYKLLTSNNPECAEKIIETLNETNNKRQDLTKKAVFEAKEIIESSQKDNRAFFVKKNWEPGILGLVAGRLCEYYNKPVFVFTKIGEEIVGSGRSIPEFNITDELFKVKKYVKRYGGHKQACGLSLLSEDVYDDFIKDFLKIAENELKGRDLSRFIKIDAEIELKDASWILWDEIKKIEPFGNSNDEPVFLFSGLEVVEAKAVGQDGKHLKLKLRDNGSFINAIGFFFFFEADENEQVWADKLNVGDSIDVAAFIDVNEWNGNRELQLRLIDLRMNREE